MANRPRVHISQVIPGSIEDVWERIRQFDSIDAWHPGITDCTIDGDAASTEVGAVRNFDAGGRTVREKLIAYSEREQFYQYTMADDDEKDDYVGELQLVPITETGETFGTWVGYFDMNRKNIEEENEHLSNVYAAGLNNLRDEFS